MNSKSTQNNSGAEILKWIAIAALFGAGLSANYYFTDITGPVRMIAWLVLVCTLLLVAAQTLAGKKFLEFGRESKVELRKVVWPSRQETIQVTTLVIVLVLITAAILWGIDSVLLWAVSHITG